MVLLAGSAVNFHRQLRRHPRPWRWEPSTWGTPAVPFCALDVLRLVALGWRNEYIADELGVTLNTVRAHVTNLRHKLDADSRYGAVMAALRLGMLELR